jgi:integrase
MGLTIKGIAAKKNRPGRYHDGNGLYLQVPVAGEKQPRASRASWLLRYERNGVEHWMGLGKLRLNTLAKAREKAADAQRLLEDGIDPIKHRQRELKARADDEAKVEAEQARKKTFEQCATAFLAKHSNGWRSAKHREQWKSSLATYANPVIGKMYVGDIDTPHIVDMLEPMWEDKQPTARRVLGRVERILNFAKASGYRTGDNPAAWRGHLKDLMASNGKTDAHHAALPYSELPAFMAELREREGIAARALEFLVLTAARTGEVRLATEAELDLKEKVWTIPAKRMKAGKEHKVPLSDRAVALLATVPREGHFLFVGAKKGEPFGPLSLTRMLERMGRNVTVHGFRSAFMDWAHDTTAFPKVVIDQALAHAVGDKVEAAYRRGELLEKRRKLMEAWSRYCASKPAVDVSGKVVSLRKAR